MSLVHAEWRRLFKRRFTVWMLAIVVLLLATIAVLVAFNNQKPGPAALAQAEAEAARQFQEQQGWMEQEIQECERAWEAGEEDFWPEDCQEIRDWYASQEEMVEWYAPPTFEFRESYPDMITVLVGLLAMFAFLVGASFVGAEWRSGAMMNLLLWRPRRLQVLGAKLATLLGALLGIGLALGAVWTAAFWLVAEARGVTDTMTAGAWQSIGLTGLRGLTLVLVAGAVGFALASLGRHTAMALGSLIAAFVVGVVGLGIVVSLAEVRYPEAWLWPTYVAAWLEKVVVLQDWRSCDFVGPSQDCTYATMEITWQRSGIVMGAVVIVAVAAAAWQMRRRDIT